MCHHCVHIYNITVFKLSIVFEDAARLCLKAKRVKQFCFCSHC